MHIRTMQTLRKKSNDRNGYEQVNYPTLLGLTASLRVGLPGSVSGLASVVDTSAPDSAGVDSECPTPIGSMGRFHGLTHASCRV